MTGLFRFGLSSAFLLGLAWSLPSHAAPSFEVIASFDASQGQTPESITADRGGNLYFSWSGAGSLQKRTPDGTIVTIGKLPIAASALGVKVGPDGCLYNVSAGTSGPSAFVWRICTPGDVEQFAALDPKGFPNDLAFDDDGNLYVTDSFLSRIYQVDRRGHVRDWFESPLLAGDPEAPLAVFHAIGADGIAFDADKRHLYVTNFDRGAIVRIDVHHGTAGEASVFASSSLLKGSDGIAFDENGDLLSAVNTQDSIVAIKPDGALEVLGTGGVLDGCSSIVFGTTRRDRHTMYVANSAYLRANGYEAGTPHAGLLAAEHRTAGLRLP